MSSTTRRVCIIGGVAGGASAAARLRRVDESAQITVFERGPFASFANCGLPYRVGKVIDDDAKLIIASPELFKERFNIDVKVNHTVHSINRQAKTIQIEDKAGGNVYTEPYDQLVLAPGAKAIRPPLPGLDLPGVFVVKTIPDMRAVRSWLEGGVKTATVIGGGFIGLEMAENLCKIGLKVTVIEKFPHVMPPLDAEMASIVMKHITGAGADLLADVGFTGITAKDDGTLDVACDNGAVVNSGIVILSVGVSPENKLAKDAGLELGVRGSIKVNAQMRTSDPNIYAVGDATEVNDFVSGARTNLPLAGPANRQGRIAADAIVGRPTRFRGVQGTSVCEAFGSVVAMTGMSEKAAKAAGKANLASIMLHPGTHVGYYPDASPIHLKLVFDSVSGQVLGAQAVGKDTHTVRRIDVLATYIQMNGTVFDLAEAELCYSPQFGAAKDPVNVAGMIASNFLNGDIDVVDWSVYDPENADELTLDVRLPEEFAEDHIPNATNIPLEELRARMSELPADTPINVCCRVGQRAYYGVRALRQYGYNARLLSGGLLTWAMRQGRDPESLGY